MYRFTILLLCVLSPITATRADADHGTGTERRSAGREPECKRFVQAFYNWYTRASQNGIGFERAIEQKPVLFGRELLRRLREDVAAQKRSPGELVGLDFDPFLNAQDIAERYDVAKVTRQGGAYLAEVFGRYKGEKPGPPTVVAEVRFDHRRWVFANFHYGRQATKSGNEDLLTVLARLRSDRAKRR